MAISHKRKRKITFKNNLYLWFIAQDDDSNDYYLTIVSEDKKLYLSYRINQISDQLIRPKITILKSERFERGTYHFFPPIADEIISNHNVGAILNWYTNLDERAKPNQFKRIENPFEGIDFGNGIINHLETDFSRENLRKGLLLLQVRYSSYILDIGWYGSEKGYIIKIIKNQNWKDPILKAHKAFYDLSESTKSAVQLIEKELHK